MQHQITCSRCKAVLDYTAQPPRFCSQCGQPITAPASDSGGTNPTVAFVPDPSTRLDTDPDPHPRTTPPPQCVGGYRLLRPLGSGGMGTVYEAEQEGTGRRVAVKLIRAEFADSHEAVERFRREGRLASTISHPRCVFVLAAEEEQGRPYIVMELMPGQNLNDLVERRGPLPLAEAVALILDIIEGLEEAHRCGLVHRDVKPSNCFLDATGRVKVGDFGLAKSLLKDQHLTHTGAFLGTLLYAAPEQIRMDPVDHRADIYSVGATLYFLLTGRAPFQTEDAAATLARTMSDPLTPMRKHRPELPGTLDEIVRRALERRPDQRYQTLEELRLALLPFLPGDHSLGTLGLRFCAFAVDLLILWPLELLLFLAVGGLSLVLHIVLGLLYFGLLESKYGWTPGKWLFRLRVRDAKSHDRPRPAQALLRTTIFYLFRDFGPLIVLSLANPLKYVLGAATGGSSMNLLLYSAFVVWVLPLVTSVLGLVLTTATMRRRNGYRGVHELASGTVTIRLASRRERRALKVSNHVQDPSAETLVPNQMGAFRVRQALTWQEDCGLLLGEDSGLGRQVWIWTHANPDNLASPTRREVGRTTRPRWVASGTLEGRAWDAFVAAPGCPLPNLTRAGRRMLWADFLPLLEQLADELGAAVSDGTLPRVLTLGQIWIEPSGRVQLLDAPLTAASPAESGTDAARALRLLGEACRFALEGKQPGEMATPHLAAPLPGSANVLLDRLLGVGEPYTHPAEFRRDLESLKEQPTEVGHSRRGVHLVLQALLLSIGLIFMFLSVPLMVQGPFVDRFFAGALGEAAQRHFQRIDPENLASLAQSDVERSETTLDPDTLVTELLVESAKLKEQLRAGKREGELVLGSCSAWVRDLVEGLRQEFTENIYQDRFESDADNRPLLPNAVTLLRDMKLASQAFKESAPLLEHDSAGDVLVVLAWIGLFPMLWALWALLTRGGLCRLLVGIRLVQADGRPAPRWRCLWRAAIIWLPLVVLLTLSTSADLYRLTHYREEPAAGWLLAWIAWGSWWMALLLLPLYAWFARQTPAQSLHDRLAGTFQVPA